jgi:hypothetical protein
MNAELIVVLYDVIYETKHEILRGEERVATHPLVADVAKNLDSSKVEAAMA